MVEDRRDRAANPFDRADAVDALVGRPLAEIERALVLATMARCGGNRTFAADLLGIDAQTLRDRLLDYNRAAESKTRAFERREAQLAADRHRGDGPRPTYVPSPSHLA